MKGNQGFEQIVLMPRTADALLGPVLPLRNKQTLRRPGPETVTPFLRVLPQPEVDVSGSWFFRELRECARFERYQDAAFLLLGLSGLAAIIRAFFAIYA